MSIYDYSGNVLMQGMPSTLVVAAYDSSDQDKSLADYICDGTNDEVELQTALDRFGTKSGKVILCDGNYYIGSLYTDATYGKFGLCVKNPNIRRDITICGTSHPNRIGNYSIGIGATINLTAGAYNSISADDTVTVVGALGPISYPYLNITLDRIGFNVPGTQKKITVIDLQRFANGRIDYCLLGLSDGVAPSSSPNSEFVGIRGLPGWNFGAGYYIKNCFVYGTGVAYDIGGEHLIMEDCGCRFCDITYRFNAYDNPNKMSHPQTLINCCEELCIRSMYFCQCDTKQNITLIDFNIEERPTQYPNFSRSTKAVEERPGDYVGIITYTGNLENYINTDIVFWEDGSGINFKTINTIYANESN